VQKLGDRKCGGDRVHGGDLRRMGGTGQHEGGRGAWRG